MAQVLRYLGCNERGRIACLLSGIVRVQRRCGDKLRLQLFLPMAQQPFISLNVSKEPTNSRFASEQMYRGAGRARSLNSSSWHAHCSSLKPRREIRSAEVVRSDCVVVLSPDPPGSVRIGANEGRQDCSKRPYVASGSSHCQALRCGGAKWCSALHWRCVQDLFYHIGLRSPHHKLRTKI